MQGESHLTLVVPTDKSEQLSREVGRMPTAGSRSI
jgi:hypothetical protein